MIYSPFDYYKGYTGMDLTFLALCEADDISRVEGQANADNKQIVGLKPYQ